MDGRVSQKKIFLDDCCSPKIQFALARKKLIETFKSQSKKKLKEDLKFQTQQKRKSSSIKASKILNDELFLSSHILCSNNPLKTQPNNNIHSITYYLRNEAKILKSFKQNNIYDIKLRDLLNRKLPSAHKGIIFRNTEIRQKIKSKTTQKMRKFHENKVNIIKSLPVINQNGLNQEIIFIVTKKNNYKIS